MKQFMHSASKTQAVLKIFLIILRVCFMLIISFTANF